MIRLQMRDVLWTLVIVVLCAAWGVDHWLLASKLKNCRFALEHLRQTISELSNE